VTIWEIARAVYDRQYRTGRALEAPQSALTLAAQEITEGYRDLAEAREAVQTLGDTGNVGSTLMGYLYNAHTLRMAIAVLEEDEPVIMRSLAACLDKQHPDRYDRGTWYPAQDPISGDALEIKRTTGKGRARGRSFLHIRRTVSLVLRDPDGTTELVGQDYQHVRVNRQTGETVIL